METFAFSALGTKWSIMVDGAPFLEKHQKAIQDEIAHFENRFSRFIATSEVNQFRGAEPGAYPLSETLALLLEAASTLRTLTGGVYDPAVGGLLEHAGYDPTYRMTATDLAVEQYQLPQWSLVGRELTLGGSVVFDLGGIGKGYCIDLAAEALKRLGYQHFLVEGGGDMYGTTKQDGSGFRIALEWPGKPDTAFGIVELKNQGVAVSDSFKRRWGKWHHIVDPHTKKPIDHIIGAAAVAPSAFAADRMTSGLFLSTKERYPALAQALSAQFVIFEEGGTVQISSQWVGELF